MRGKGCGINFNYVEDILFHDNKIMVRNAVDKGVIFNGNEKIDVENSLRNSLCNGIAQNWNEDLISQEDVDRMVEMLPVESCLAEYDS